MLAYAANRPTAAKRQSSPNALLLVISVHVAILAVVMSAKMDLPSRIRDRPITVEFLPEATPAARQDKPETNSRPLPLPIEAPLDHQSPRVAPLVVNSDEHAQATMPPIDFGNLLGTEGSNLATETVHPSSSARREARLLTSPSELKPPYPASKLALGEEAVLTLRLSIDERGRVSAVDPVGPADRAFLDAARRYLIGHWRYEPAAEDGRPIPSTATIVLHFQLDG